MLNGFQNASKIPELRRRVLFTLAMLAVYRLGVHVPTPGIDRQALAAYFEQVKGTIFGRPGPNIRPEKTLPSSLVIME